MGLCTFVIPLDDVSGRLGMATRRFKQKGNRFVDALGYGTNNNKQQQKQQQCWTYLNMLHEITWTCIYR